MNDSRILEDVAYLRRVVEDSRRVVVDNGVQFLVWGVLVVLGMILTYASIHLNLDFPVGWMWFFLIGAGWVLSFWMGWKRFRKAPVQTFAQKILAALWIGLGITMTIIGFLGPITGAISDWAVVPLLSFVLGSGFLATSAIHQEKMLGIAAFGWWIGGSVTMFWPGDYMLLLFAGMMIAFQIAPGILVYRKWKREMGARADA